MCHSPVGYGYLMLVVLGVVLGFISCISLADYSIGTYIENTGPVRESFSGSFSLHDENNTHISGIYIDSVMSNDGNLSLTKSVKMNEIGAMDQGFETQKSLKYSSNNTGGHVMADEYSQSSIDYFENRTGSICFGHPYILPPDIARAHSASFSIIHAEELVLTSMSRSSNGTLDYALQIGTSGKNGTVGLDGSIITRFDGKTIGKNNEVTLYDRTLIAGLLETLTRLYRGGEEIDLTATTIGTGPVHDTTVLEQKSHTNDTSVGKAYASTAMYGQNIMTNGGKINDLREITGADSIRADRMVEYASEGDRSIQASEHAIVTKTMNQYGAAESPACVFADVDASTNESSPYTQAASDTSIAGVSSVQMTSTTLMSKPGSAQEINLAYKADMMIPIGFNPLLANNMQDTDNDGRYEDLNGNGHLDMHDLVLLFQNFRRIGESNLSLRIDFNKNGRADYADIVTIFNSLNRTPREKG